MTQPTPRKPDKVKEIVKLREKQKLTWREIGAKVGDTHQGPYLLYQRWHEWAKMDQQINAHKNQ